VRKKRFKEVTFTSTQFHQHFTSSFCTNILSPKNYKAKTVIKEKLHKALSYEKGTRKMLMKLTPGISIRTTFYEALLQ